MKYEQQCCSNTLAILQTTQSIKEREDHTAQETVSVAESHDREEERLAKNQPKPDKNSPLLPQHPLQPPQVQAKLQQIQLHTQAQADITTPQSLAQSRTQLLVEHTQTLSIAQPSVQPLSSGMQSPRPSNLRNSTTVQIYSGANNSGMQSPISSPRQSHVQPNLRPPTPQSQQGLFTSSGGVPTRALAQTQGKAQQQISNQQGSQVHAANQQSSSQSSQAPIQLIAKRDRTESFTGKFSIFFCPRSVVPT